MLTAQDFYGSNVAIAHPSAGMEVAPEARPTGNLPVHFWLVFVAMLIAVRLMYEASPNA